MDGSRFDALTRSLAGGASRRGVLGGLLGLGAGLLGIRTTAAVTCPPGQVSRPRVGCVCRQTGRAPVGGVCPCPRGQTDTGDGHGCLGCRAAEECPGFGAPCLDVACGPAGECVARPVGDGEQGGCPGGHVCQAGTCQRCGFEGLPCCAEATCSTVTFVCLEGTCQLCGGPFAPCCAGETCRSEFDVCVAGTCQPCGDQQLPCCAEATCSSANLLCHEGTCRSCGVPFEPCCAGEVCSTGTCSDGFCTP